MNVSEYLLNKYNVPVPRYTSYPPANHFSDEFVAENYKELIVKSNQENPELVAFYIHIPFCDQICFYCGCNAIKMRQSHAVDEYVAMIKKEILMVSKNIDKNRKVSQIHYGGGTPNAIEARYLKEINDLLFNEFSLIDHPEVAIECNPALLTYEYMDELFQAGFNRFSFGIQDFDEEVLKDVNRKPSALPVKQLVSYVKEHDSSMAVNLDFIYGLPGQTVDGFSETIKKAIEVRPDRLVTFSYAHVPWMKENQKILDKKGLPSADEKMSMFLAAYDLLKKAGYISIGLDHYALPEDELCVAQSNHQLHRNFQGYCTKRTTGQVYAVGVSGISQLSGGYAQNTKDLKVYLKQISQDVFPIEKGYIVSVEEKLIRMVINELMCNKQVVWAIVAKAFGVSTGFVKQTISYNEDILKGFKDDELVEYAEDMLKITELGTLFIRNIVASFDPKLTSGAKRYSKSL
ncbi:oxygen-independent coproporphyrinogen III oxidase [Labilibacter sediminis]|nr:oxygen-independent coproporphyrinogen III oxidase [Labilibacter sediminis]